MNFGIPISTIQTIPSYGTHTVPVYGNSIVPSINYGLTTQLLVTPNYETTSIPTNYVQIPVTTPINQNEVIYSLVQPQMPIAPLIQPPQILFPNVPAPPILLPKDYDPHFVSNYPIDKKDPRRLPRYSVFTSRMNGYNYDDLRKISLPITSVNPIIM